MSKAMLIMDMPKSCAECQFFARFDLVKNCSLNGKPVEYPNHKKSRQDWCPLQEVLGKACKSCYPDDYDEGYVDGYNACIDEILGGGDNEKQCAN